MIKALIFDFDMTLVDSLAIGNKAWMDLEQKHGLSLGGIPLCEFWKMQHEEASRKIAEINDNKVTWQEISRLDKEVMRDSYTNLEIRSRESLKRLAENGIPLGIISNNSTELINEILKNDYNNDIPFQVVFGAENMSPGEDKSHLLVELVEVWRVSPKEMMYIGDAVSDVRYAKKAGVVAVAIPTGLDSEEELRAYAPDIILADLSDIEKYC